jgi:hypothetical protein
VTRPIGSILRAAAALAVAAPLALAPAPAAACTWCVASAFGDRSFNWPYLGLILAPFIVGVVIAVVLARSAGVELRSILRRRRGAAAASEAPEPIKETT